MAGRRAPKTGIERGLLLFGRLLELAGMGVEPTLAYKSEGIDVIRLDPDLTAVELCAEAAAISERIRVLGF